MRILMIWGESLGKPGGGTTHFIGLAQALVRAKRELTVITPDYGKQTLFTGGLAVHTVSLPRRSMMSFLLFQFLTMALMPFWLLRYKPRAVYVRSCFFQGALALWCRLFRTPLVGEVDSVVDEEIRMRGRSRLAPVLAKTLDGINNRLSSGLVCVTRGLAKESIRRHAREETTLPVHNGARTDIMKPGERLACRAKFGLPDSPVIIGFAGTFAPWQGLDLLVSAVGLVKKQNSNILFALLGSGRQQQELQTSIQREGLSDCFVFLPPCPQEQVADFLNACDAGVIPIHDPRKLRYGLSPLKFWDALGVGLPVLVPAGADLDDVLADLNVPGVFNPGDTQSLADEILRLARNVESYRARRDEIHKAVCEKYSWDAVAGKIAGFLDALAAARSRP